MSDEPAEKALGGAVPVVTADGKVAYLPAALANDPAATEGLRRATDDQLRGAQVGANQEATAQALRDQFSGSIGAELEGAVMPGLAGAARGLTLGGSDAALANIGGDAVRRRLLDYQNYAPVTSAVGELGAIAGAALLGDEATLGAVPNALGRLGAGAEAATARALGGGLAARSAGVLARGASEGAVYGASSAVTEKVLHDAPITGEAIIGGVAHGAAGGMIASGLLHGLGSGLSRARGALRPNAQAYESLAAREFGEAAPGVGEKLAADAEKIQPRPADVLTEPMPTGPYRKPGDVIGEKYLDTTTSGARRDELGEVWKNREVAFNDGAERIEGHSRDLAKAISEQQRAASVTDMSTFGESKVNHMAKLVSPSRFNEQASLVRTWMAEAQELAATVGSDSLGGLGPVARKQFDEQMIRLSHAIESGDGHALFTAADNAKRWVGRQAQFGRSALGLTEAARGFDALYQGDSGLMRVLEGDAWGKAGAAQKTVNAATAESIGLGSRFKSGFVTEHGSEAGRPINVADTGKVSGFLGRLTKAANDLDAQSVRDMIRTRRAFLDATASSYDHGGAAVKAIAAERVALDKMEATFGAATKETALINQVKRLQSEEQAQKIGGLIGLATDTLSKPVTTLQRLAQIEQHVQSTLDKISGGSRKLTNAAAPAEKRATGLAPPKGAGAGFFSLLLDKVPVAGERAAIAGASTQRKDFDKRAETMAALQANPTALTSRVGGALGPFATDAPKATLAATNVAMAGLQFLASKMPLSRRDPFTLQPQLQPTTRASDSEISQHTRYVEALDNPTIVLDLARKGALTPDHVEAVKAVYPKLYDKMRTDLFQELVTSKSELPYSRRIQLGILLDLPTDQTLAPDFVSAIQATYSASDKAGVEPPPPQLSTLDVSSPSMTATQVAASGGLDR